MELAARADHTAGSVDGIFRHGVGAVLVDEDSKDAPGQRLLEIAAAPGASGAAPPVLLLVSRAGTIPPHLVARVAGSVRRDAPGPTLLAATLAVAAGLRVADPRLPVGPFGSAGAVASSADAGDVGRARRRDSGPRRRRAPAERLTPREREVVALLAEGMANKEIAAALHVSANTVKYHLAEIMQKLGARTRTEAVVAATRAGFLQL